MFKSKFLTICALSAAFMSSTVVTPLLAKSHHSDSHKIEESFKARDFAGDFVLDVDSVGGISGNSGESFTVIGKLKFNRNGTGTVHFFSSAAYLGPIGSTPIGVQLNLRG